MRDRGGAGRHAQAALPTQVGPPAHGRRGGAAGGAPRGGARGSFGRAGGRVGCWVVTQIPACTPRVRVSVALGFI